MSLAVIGAPTNLGLRPLRPGHEPGTRAAPGALRAAGLVEALGARDAGDVDAPPYSPDREPTTGVRNGPGIAAYSVALADAVGGVLDAGEVPVVVGGDCSVILAGLLALRRRAERVGLVYVDGHLDFRHPGNGEVGAVAGETLALATGRGTPVLTDLEGRGAPYVADADVVALGARELGEEEAPAYASAIDVVDLPRVRELGGPAAAAEHAVARLAERGLAGAPVWLHVDIDVLDSDLMPAVDSPFPDGYTYDELAATLRTLLPHVAGVEITIFDPDLDPSGTHARTLVDCLAAGLAV